MRKRQDLNDKKVRVRKCPNSTSYYLHEVRCRMPRVMLLTLKVLCAVNKVSHAKGRAT